MSSEYSENMSLAQANVAKIDDFISKTDRSGLFPRNIVAETSYNSIAVANLFGETFEIYRTYNQQDAARKLSDKLFDCVNSCDEFTSLLKTHLLLSTKDQIAWLDQLVPGTKQRVKDGLRQAYGGHLFEIETAFWLLTLVTEDRQNNSNRSLLEYLRDLADSDEERAAIDLAITKTAELAAHFCIARGVNLDTAEMWYRQAATVADTRLADHSYASQLLRQASTTNRMSSQRVYNDPHIAQAMRSAPGTKEYADAMSKLGIAENLTVMMHKNLEANPPSSFLEPPTELAQKYDGVEDKLAELVADMRFVLNRTAIEARIAQAKSPGTSFMEWVGVGQFVDPNGNPRGSYGNTESIICQYVEEVANSIAYLMFTWIGQSSIDQDMIKQKIAAILPNYDLQIFESGVNSFFNGDFISATHSLIPQFENIFREWLKLQGADTKKLNRQNVSSEMLLHDFLNAGNTQVQRILGNEFFAILAWYLVNDGPFDYRNKLAHGWLTGNECSRPHIPAMIIFFTLKIMSLGSTAASPPNIAST